MIGPSHSSGTSVMRETTHILLGFKATLRQNSCLALLTRTRTHSEVGHRPSRRTYYKYLHWLQDLSSYPRLVHLPTRISEKLLSAVNSEQHRHSQLADVQRIRVCRVLSSKWDIYITLSSKGSSSQKDCQAIGTGWLQQNTVSRAQQSGCTCGTHSNYESMHKTYPHKIKLDKSPA